MDWIDVGRDHKVLVDGDKALGYVRRLVNGRYRAYYWFKPCTFKSKGDELLFGIERGVIAANYKECGDARVAVEKYFNKNNYLKPFKWVHSHGMLDQYLNTDANLVLGYTCRAGPNHWRAMLYEPAIPYLGLTDNVKYDVRQKNKRSLGEEFNTRDEAKIAIQNHFAEIVFPQIIMDYGLQELKIFDAINKEVNKAVVKLCKVKNIEVRGNIEIIIHL